MRLDGKRRRANALKLRYAGGPDTLWRHLLVDICKVGRVVKETRITFEPGDILALRFVCQGCNAETLYKLGAPAYPSRCSGCTRPLINAGDADSFENRLRVLVNMLCSIRQTLNAPFKVRLEFDGED